MFASFCSHEIFVFLSTSSWEVESLYWVSAIFCVCSVAKPSFQHRDMPEVGREGANCNERKVPNIQKASAGFY